MQIWGRMRAGATTLAVTVLAGLLAACGGGGEDTGGTVATVDFVAAADRICVDAAERDIAARHAGLPTQVAYLERLRDDREEVLAQLEALEAPDDAAASFDRYVESRRRALQGLREGIDAAERGDEAATEEFRAAARRRVLAGLALASDAGLVACAGALDPAERQAVEETIALSVVPKQAREFCSKHTSEAMVATNFGSVSECIRQQSRRSRASAVSIEELRGIDGISADAVVALGEGEKVSGHYEAALVYEDGVWKFDAVTEAPDGA